MMIESWEMSSGVDPTEHHPPSPVRGRLAMFEMKDRIKDPQGTWDVGH